MLSGKSYKDNSWIIVCLKQNSLGDMKKGTYGLQRLTSKIGHLSKSPIQDNPSTKLVPTHCIFHNC